MIAGISLPSLIGKKLWSPRAAFPPSRPLSNRVFTCGGGLYLMTNPKHGDGDPVRAVGWAQSDYWAQRAWESPPFRGELAPPLPQWDRPPSLEFLGRPEDLSFGSVRAFEKAQPEARKATLVNATYRLTDGAFLYCAINGTDGVTYIYGSNDPKPDQQPVAIEFRLPEQ